MEKWQASALNEFDRYLFHQGTHYAAYTFMGGHLREEGGQAGARFTVWAPKATRVSVVGDFNQWDGRKTLGKMPESGLWSAFVPGLKRGHYK